MNPLMIPRSCTLKNMDATNEDRPQPRWLRLSTADHCQSFATRQHEVTLYRVVCSIVK